MESQVGVSAVPAGELRGARAPAPGRLAAGALQAGGAPKAHRGPALCSWSPRQPDKQELDR